MNCILIANDFSFKILLREKEYFFKDKTLILSSVNMCLKKIINNVDVCQDCKEACMNDKVMAIYQSTTMPRGEGGL